MPRARMETAFLGATTVKILRGVSEHVAGWLIKALCDWIEADVLPVDIPEECLGSWIAIRDESERIHDRLRQLRKNGSLGGRPPKPDGNQTETKGKPNGNQTETKKKIKTKIESLRSSVPSVEKEGELKPKNPKPEVARVRARIRERTMDVLDLRTEEQIESVFDDPVDAALAISGELSTDQSRNCWGAYLKRLGKHEFLDCLVRYIDDARVDRDIGRPLRNPAAALNERMKARAAISEALEGPKRA